MQDNCNTSDKSDIFAMFPFADCLNSITIYVFSEKSFEGILGTFATKGIILLFFTVVLTAFRFFRSSIFPTSTSDIMFEDLPYVDRILELCWDIYLVRETQDFKLEEDLFAKLIFAYRSPETLIKYSRLKRDEVGLKVE